MSRYSLAFTVLVAALHGGSAFVAPPLRQATSRALLRPVFMSTQATQEVQSMRAREIKQELESYGISTKSMFEKTELVAALVDARKKGLKAKKEPKTTETTTTTTTSTSEPQSSSSSASSSTTSSSSSSSSSSTSSKSREERIAEETEKCKSMKAGELKKELEALGVSTKSFFEKSEFVKALAEARVDGVKKPQGGSSRSSSSCGASVDEEGYAEYKDVEVLTGDDVGPRKRSREEEQGGGGGGGNPFGGAGGGNPFGGAGAGGMGGMGNIADMLKKMGMGGAGGAGAGANPFGGAGGSPFGDMGGMGGMGGMGDAFAKAQQMMQNPKVQQLMAKAQNNPKVLAAMQECMSNPAAMSKYMSDPEVGPIIKELRQYMMQ